MEEDLDLGIVAGIVKGWLQQKESMKRADFVSEVAVQQLKKATWLLGGFQILLLILFATAGGSQVMDSTQHAGTGSQGYNMFIGVEIMMFIGFGYLMTFLKSYGLGAVTLTMLITAVGLQWAVLTESFWGQLMTNSTSWHQVDLNIYSLLNALYAISAVLISFGAVIGKVSPFQLVVMTIIELQFHSLNFKVLMTGLLNVCDMGGTYIDHMFGAYFGLAVAYMLGKPRTEPVLSNNADLFSLLGTLFLWVYWPSFVAGAANIDEMQQQRAIVNTILALSSSTVAAFWLSSVFSRDGRFRPVDLQNATLAGGVAIGATANLSITAFGALTIGIAAGLVSAFAYNVIQPKLEHYGVHDTCGIHNLHAIPSVIGALASVFVAFRTVGVNQPPDQEIYGPTHRQQWWHQLVGIVVCISFAIASGCFTGKLLRSLSPNETNEFHDNCYFVKVEPPKAPPQEFSQYAAVAQTASALEMIEQGSKGAVSNPML